jgi:hypothetical protein
MNKTKLYEYTLKDLINVMIDDVDFALTPQNPEPNQRYKDLFQLFKSTNKNDVYKGLLDMHNEKGFVFALDTVKHYKGDFNYFHEELDFKLYQKIKPWLDDNSKKRYREHFFREYGKACLNDEIEELDDYLLNKILTNDIHLYMRIARKLRIEDAGKIIFNHSPSVIYIWLNDSPNVYDELVKLDQGEFILKNMENKLNATTNTWKYILENSEPNIQTLNVIKKNIGFHPLWDISNHIFKPEFYVNLIETIEDFIFVINIHNMDLNSLELILNGVKEKFPHIYSNLDSLLFVKKEFNNK